jgi:hypothetical protein
MRRTDIDVELRRLAERQHGVVSRAQVRHLGLGRAGVARRLDGAEWERLSSQVLRLAGSRRSFEQRCMAGALDRGGVVSGVTAASLWRLPGFVGGPVHVSLLRGTNGSTSSLALQHRPRFLPERHHTVLDGVPVTTVARTLFDLAGSVHPKRAERALDNGLSHRLVDLESLRLVTIELLARGRKGSALMRLLLTDRGAGYIPPASGLEARFLAALIEAGVELPERQVDLGGDTWQARVDFLYRLLRLVIEIDSDRHHSAKSDREADARRDAALRAAGFRVLRISEEDLCQRPHLVVASIRSALSQAA